MKELFFGLLEFLKGLDGWVQGLLVAGLFAIILLIALNPATGPTLLAFVAGLVAVFRGIRRAR